MQADITRCVELGPSSRRRESRSYYRMHLYIRVFELYVAAIDIPHSVTRDVRRAPPRGRLRCGGRARRVDGLCRLTSPYSRPAPSRLSESRTQRFWVLGSYVAVGSRDPSCGHGSRAPDTTARRLHSCPLRVLPPPLTARSFGRHAGRDAAARRRDISASIYGVMDQMRWLL